jgi:cytochrome c oxidase assembly protein subunit 15
MLAYMLWLAALLHVVDVVRTIRSGPAVAGAVALFLGLTVQASLGILTLIHQAPLPLALAHQGMAMIVLTIAAVHAERFASGDDRFTPWPAPAPDPR